MEDRTVCPVQSAECIFNMFRHSYKKRIRYGETDKMGYLYYGNYPLLYEIGRSEMLRSVGITYREMEDDMKVMMPVVHLESTYKRPIYYDEEIEIVTILKELPTKVIHFYQEIYKENGELANEGSVKLVFVKDGKVVPAPAEVVAAMKPYMTKDA